MIVFWTTIFEPVLACMANASPPTVSGNAFLDPLNRFEKSSRACNSPIVHILNSSWWTFCSVNWNGLNGTCSTGTAYDSPGAVANVGTVNTWDSPYPNPVLVISKSITLPPVVATPTVMFALAWDPPTPGVAAWSYQRGISWYGNGASMIASNVDEPTPVKPGTGLVCVIAILTTRPFVTAAVPINSIVGVPVEVVNATPTLTSVAIPTPPIELVDDKPE